jgi:dTDP-4-amino-4,6-dideoxygalactose transaminase
VLNTAFSPWPSFTSEETQAVASVLASNRVNYWTGRECRDFESEFAAWTGAQHAIALANGTLALDLGVKALGIGAGDEVVVTPRTFIASVSCVVNAGATPVFADVDADSGNLSAQTIEQVLTPRTKAVICVHLAGWPCDMDPIMSLAHGRGIYVIEDCAQAHGARYRGRSVGTIGHLGAWSFCQDKIMTLGGEGGMVTTNDPGVASRIWSLKDHGKSCAAAKPREGSGFRWVHESFGTNARMLEIQAVLGRIQLGRMARWTAQRNAHADAIQTALRPFAGPSGVLRTPRFRCGGRDADGATSGCADGCEHARYKYYAYVRPENFAQEWTRDRVIEAITSRGVPCYSGSCSEVYLEKAFQGISWRPGERLPVAQELGETSLMWLVHPTLTQDEMRKTCEVSAEVLREAQRADAE